MNPLNEPSPEALVSDGCAPALDGGADCSELFAKLDLLLDRELPLHELDQLEVHLAACLPCAGRRDFESQLRAVVRSRCADQAPAALVEKIRAKLELPESPVS